MVATLRGVDPRRVTHAHTSPFPFRTPHSRGSTSPLLILRTAKKTLRLRAYSLVYSISHSTLAHDVNWNAVDGPDPDPAICEPC